MTRFEYMRLKLSDIPEDVIDHYQLRKIATPDGFVYCEIQKGMYGLPQAGIITQELLAERLAKHGYHQSKTTPGLWTHDTRPIWFSLVVDDFGVKYVGEEHAQHLLNVVQKYYKCSCDWVGERYCGLTLKWDYTGRKVHLTMPNYVSKALTRFQHPPPNKPQDQPYPHVKPNYGAKKQYARPDDQSPPLNKAGKKFVQEVCGVFLFLARGIDGAFCRHSARSHPSKPIRQNAQWNSARIFSATWRHRNKQYSPIKPAKWSWQFIVTPPTFRKRTHAVVPAATCLWPPTKTSPKITVPY